MMSSSRVLPPIFLTMGNDSLHPTIHPLPNNSPLPVPSRSPLPSPPLSAYSYPHQHQQHHQHILSSAHSTPPQHHLAPPQPTQPSTIAPPPIQTASDMIEQEKVKKKHVCPTCSRPFTTSGHLARHLRVHTGERNHKCPFPGCETRCSRQDNLQQHYRIHLSPRSRRNSNAATRAAIAKAMEAQANGGSPAPVSSPSTTLTLPPQSNAPQHSLSHHQSRASSTALVRPSPSPIENALGLAEPPTSSSSPAPGPPTYQPPIGRGYPSNRGFGHDTPARSSSAASSVQANAYPSPYSTGPMHHPLPPTGSQPPSRVSPANAYPSPEENQYTYNAQQGYNYSIPPPNNYYQPQQPPQQQQQRAYQASPPPVLPPIQQAWNPRSAGPQAAGYGWHHGPQDSGRDEGDWSGPPPARPVGASY